MLNNTYNHIAYDDRNAPQAGFFRGVGEPGKTGLLKSTYTINAYGNDKANVKKIPRVNN